MNYEVIIAIIAVMVSLIIFVYQYQQNYINHIFQMINTFNSHYSSLSYLIDKEHNYTSNVRCNTNKLLNEEALHLKGNDVIKYIFRKIADYDEFSICPRKFKSNSKKFKYLINTWKRIKLSHIDNLVILALIINQYIDRGYFNKFISYVFDIDKFSSNLNDYLPNKFKEDYSIFESYFKNLIFKEFKLLVLLLYISEPKELYYKFLSIEHFGALKDEDLSYFLEGEEDYHKFIKRIVECNMNKLNRA